MSKDEITTYPGQQADVHWNGRLCIHVGECGRSAGELFVGGRKPWCQPDTTTLDDVVDVVERCPTGALTYTRKDAGPPEATPELNTVVVANHGPLYLRGQLEIEGAPEDQGGTKTRAALCRCGQSKNKPFCDGAHEKAGFSDRGAVGKKGNGAQGQGGKLSVALAKNGPLLLSGHFRISTGAARIAWEGSKASLCRCGQSKNKPFCDGSHKAAGFIAE